jgi:hypothetical protein
MAAKTRIGTSKNTCSKMKIGIRISIAVFIFFLFCDAGIVVKNTNSLPKRREVIITSNKETIRASVNIENKKIRIDNDRLYFGYYLNKLYRTQGEIQGRPLDGKFSRYDLNNNILESGNFEMGLKEGIWKLFSNGGYLIEVAEYQKGMLHGHRLIYKGGQPDILEKYRNGKLKGKPRSFNSKKAGGDLKASNNKDEKQPRKGHESSEPHKSQDNGTGNSSNPSINNDNKRNN